VFGPRRTSERPKRSLLGTFFWVLLLVCVARFVLLECTAAHGPLARSPTGDPSVAHAGTSGAGESGRASDARSSIELHLPLGVPTDKDPSDDRMLDEHAFVISYSPTKRVPNWVGWRLDRSYFGRVKRRNDFRPDPLLPSELYHVSERDYLHSGYDRGHMCPSADREDTPEDNSTTFLFTNMQPQLHELNAGPWEKLESYERELASQPGAVLYIVAGGVFSNPPPTIGQGVAVPAANFKIIAVLREGERASDVNERTKIVSVLMPNEPGVGEHDWTEFLTSVDAVERATGYDFLSAIPEPVSRVIEARRADL